MVVCNGTYIIFLFCYNNGHVTVTMLLVSEDFTVKILGRFSVLANISLAESS